MNDSLVSHEQRPPETREESLSRQFYEWEQRGRGWQVYDFPVEIEPPFRAFFLFDDLADSPPVDDGKQSTFLSSLVESFRKKSSQSSLSDTDQLDEYRSFIVQTNEPSFCQYYNERFTEFQLALPNDLKVSKPVAEQLLLSLSHATNPVSFEIVGNTEEILVQVAATSADLAQVRQQIKAHLPEIEVLESNDRLENNWLNSGDYGMIVDFGLSNEFMLPLNAVSGFEPDPLNIIIGALSNLEENETGVFQVLLQKTRFDWAEEMVNSVRSFDGSPFFINAPEMIPLAKQKAGRPLFAVVIRVAAKSFSSDRAWNIVRSLGAGLSPLSNPGGNELIPLSNDYYPQNRHQQALLDRLSFRCGMVLNSEELVSVVHPPSHSVQSEKLVRKSEKTKAAPPIAFGHSLILGENRHQNEVRQVTLSSEQRTKHIHLIGSTGSGKTSLMLSLIRQDMEQNQGLCVIDPHGDLIDEVIANVPEHRIKDIVVFDPSDNEFPIGFNILQAHSELEKIILSSDLVATFRRMSTSWGDVMDSVLANAILAFVESTRCGTLFDLRRFLVEKGFREEFLQTVTDENVRYFWLNEFPLITGKPQSSILIRLDAFLRQKLIRNIVCQKENRLNFRELMDDRKIPLIKLSQGLIGEENAHLLGTLLVSKLYQTALSRQDSADRPHFWLYLDEFHHFITPSMESILSGVRKYNIGLILAHQEFRQLQSRSQEVAASVLSNCYTRICFRLGDTDAERFAAGFSSFDAKALQNQSVGEAIARIERAEYDFNLNTRPLEKINFSLANQRKEAVLAQTREKYATAAKEIKIETESNLPVSTKDSSVQKESNSPVLVNDTEPAGSTKGLDERAVTTGRGGKHHQELQTVIKRMAEVYGFAVEMEKNVSDGAGRIDVALEKDGARIACEVSVTSTTAYETKNILKCLEAGYDHVVVISASRKKLPILKRAVRAAIPLHQQEKIRVLGLVDMLSFLREITTPEKNSDSKKEKPVGQRLDFAQTCEFFSIGTSTLYRWIREGRVPFYRVGREYRFDRDELILMGRHDLTGKTKALVKLEPLEIEKDSPKQKKEQNSRYRKMLNLD
jgi:excisionase family DNA binding protein